MSKWMLLLIWNVVLTVAVGWHLVGGLLNPSAPLPTPTARLTPAELLTPTALYSIEQRLSSIDVSLGNLQAIGDTLFQIYLEIKYK